MRIDLGSLSVARVVQLIRAVAARAAPLQPRARCAALMRQRQEAAPTTAAAVAAGNARAVPVLLARCARPVPDAELTERRVAPPPRSRAQPTCASSSTAARWAVAGRALCAPRALKGM